MNISYTFFKAMGLEIGTSILDEANIDLAAKLIEKAKAAGVELLLPVDVKVTEASFSLKITDVLLVKALLVLSDLSTFLFGLFSLSFLASLRVSFLASLTES